jgi:hypothetical protein
MELFKKEYDGESIVDISRDVLESFDPRFNKKVENIPQDLHGIQAGTFTVTITWQADE